jgi:hypothetical protein
MSVVQATRSATANPLTYSCGCPATPRAGDSERHQDRDARYQCPGLELQGDELDHEEARAEQPR